MESLAIVAPRVRVSRPGDAIIGGIPGAAVWAGGER